MKKVSVLLIAFAMILGFTTISGANDKAPIALTDAQMAQIVAGQGPGHQSAAADLKGGMAEFVKDHVIGELPEPAHQSIASELKGDVADLMPDHVRRNP